MATNAWIEGYIDALVRGLRYFVSSCRRADARVVASQMRAGEPVGEPIHGAPAVDADRRLYANYYVRCPTSGSPPAPHNFAFARARVHRYSCACCAFACEAVCDALSLRTPQVQQILRNDEDGIRRAWSKANASAGCG